MTAIRKIATGLAWGIVLNPGFWAVAYLVATYHK